MKNYPQRKKLRLDGFDYSQNGYYFVTICTRDREHFFGKIEDGKMYMNEYAKISEQVLLDLPNHYENCQIDEYVFMPNHFHGIFIIENKVGSGLGAFRKSNHTFCEGKSSFYEGKKQHGLSEIIRGFKTFASKNINASQEEIYFSWQKSFFDVIIKNEEQLEKSREYIIMNPAKWEEDVNNVSII